MFSGFHSRIMGYKSKYLLNNLLKIKHFDLTFLEAILLQLFVLNFHLFE